jgi:hypothetical protein
MVIVGNAIFSCAIAVSCRCEEVQGFASSSQARFDQTHKSHTHMFQFRANAWNAAKQIFNDYYLPSAPFRVFFPSVHFLKVSKHLTRKRDNTEELSISMFDIGVSFVRRELLAHFIEFKQSKPFQDYFNEQLSLQALALSAAPPRRKHSRRSASQTKSKSVGRPRSVSRSKSRSDSS